MSVPPLLMFCLDRQRLERRPVEFFERLSARAAEPADRPLLVEPFEQIADRRVQLGEAVEPLMAQSRQNRSRGKRGDHSVRKISTGYGWPRRVRPARRSPERAFGPA